MSLSHRFIVIVREATELQDDAVRAARRVPCPPPHYPCGYRPQLRALMIPCIHAERSRLRRQARWNTSCGAYIYTPTATLTHVQVLQACPIVLLSSPDAG